MIIEQDQDLKDRISDLSDEVLLSIIGQESSLYREETIMYAKAELNQRGIPLTEAETEGNIPAISNDESGSDATFSKGDLLKTLLGGVTLLPLLYMIIFIGFMILAFGASVSRNASEPPINFPVLFGLHLSIMILSVGLTIFYIVNVFKNDQVEKDKKVLWAVVLFMGGIIAMPIYWYLYFWKEKRRNGGQNHA